MQEEKEPVACLTCGEKLHSPEALGEHLARRHAQSEVVPLDLEPDLLPDPGKLLTKEQEFQLGTMIQAGGPDAVKAKHRLVECYLRLVLSIVRKKNPPESKFDDMVQDGNIALMGAAEKFDPSRGFRFSTYATWCILRLLQTGHAKDRQVHIPVNIQSKVRRARRLIEAGSTPFEAAMKVGLSEEQLETGIQALDMKMVSTTAKTDEDERGIDIPAPEKSKVDPVIPIQGGSWDLMFDRLSKHMKEHGTTVVSRKDQVHDSLANWVAHQRKKKKAGTMPEVQIHLLDSIGFLWAGQDEVERNWNTFYGRLRRFKELHGHLQLTGNEGDLRRWLSHQRDRKKKGRLGKIKIRQLNALGISWALRERKSGNGPRDRMKKRIGQIVIRRDPQPDGRSLPQRWIKISDTGPAPKRWKTVARYRWEKKYGPVPPGKRLIRKNMDTMDDRLSNLFVGGAGDNIRTAHLVNPEMSRKNMASAHKGCARRNRQLGEQSRFRRIYVWCWYPVLEDKKIIVNVPFKSCKGALRAFGVDVSRIPKSGLGPEVRSAISKSPVRPVRGSDLVRSYIRYSRIDPKFGVANPAVSGGEERKKSLEGTEVWRMAVEASKLGVREIR